MKRPFWIDVATGAGAAAIAFLVYWKTLAPTVGFHDSGELAAAAATLGIPHPTGYPLFTWIGWAFAQLPLGGTVVWKLNLLSASFCALGVFLFHRLFLSLLRGHRLNPGSQRDSAASRIAAASAALVLAFSRTYWSQALIIEVYALHIVFLALATWLFLRALAENSGGVAEARTNRQWMAFSFVLGLGFSNHMMMILLAPAFLYLFFSVYGFRREAGLKIVRAVPPFFAGLLPYLYLPLRAAQKPLMNWGDPADWDAFWAHVTARQYQGKMFSSLEVSTQQLKHFLFSFPSEFGYLPLAFMIPGCLYLHRRSPRYFVFFALLFFGCLLYSVNYDFYDTGAFFLQAYAAAAITMLFGIRACLEYVSERNAFRRVAIPACAMIFLCPLVKHYRAVDESGNYAVEDYVTNLLRPLESGAILHSYSWENITSAAYYLQIVEKVRPDVLVLSNGSLHMRWYYAQLQSRYPDTFEKVRARVDVLVEEIGRMDRGETLDSSGYAARLRELHEALVGLDAPARPVYVSYGISHAAALGGMERIPWGLAMKLSEDGKSGPPAPIEFEFRPLPVNSRYAETLRTNYATAYVNQGIYWGVKMGDTAVGMNLMKRALAVKPGFAPALNWLDRLRGNP